MNYVTSHAGKESSGLITNYRYMHSKSFKGENLYNFCGFMKSTEILTQNVCMKEKKIATLILMLSASNKLKQVQ